MSTQRVRLKRVRDVVRMHQHWRHIKSRQAIYICGVYRHERRVLVIVWNPGVGFPGCDGKPVQEYVSFSVLQKEYTLMGPHPKLGDE